MAGKIDLLIKQFIGESWEDEYDFGKDKNEGSLGDAEPEKGKMHKALGLEPDTNVADAYSGDAKKLADDLSKKVGHDEAMKMLLYAGNIHKGSDIFDKAVKYLKSINEDDGYGNTTPSDLGGGNVVSYPQNPDGNNLASLSPDYKFGSGDVICSEPFKFHKRMGESAGFRRAQMPQINSVASTTNVIYHLTKNHDVRKVKMPLGDLKPAQVDMDVDKVSDKIETLPEPKDICFITCQNGHLVDSHHLWAAALQKYGEDELVTVYKVKHPIGKLLGILNRMKCTYKDGDFDEEQDNYLPNM